MADYSPAKNLESEAMAPIVAVQAKKRKSKNGKGESSSGTKKSKKSQEIEKGKAVMEEGTDPDILTDNLYFNRKSMKVRYETSFCTRRVLKGRFMDFEFFERMGLNFRGKFGSLGWIEMANLKEVVYPDLVRHFYANLRLSTKNPNNLISFVKGIKIKISGKLLEQIFGLPRTGIVDHSKKLREVFSKILGRTVRSKIKTSIAYNELSLEHKIVHHFINHCLAPRSGKFEYVSKLELLLLWCYSSKSKQPLMTQILLDKMIAVSKHKTCTLPYGMALTRIFKHFDVDLRDEHEEVIKEKHDGINESTLKSMKYERNSENQWVKKGEGQTSTAPTPPAESEKAEDSDTEPNMVDILNTCLAMFETLEDKIDDLTKEVKELRMELKQSKEEKENVEEQEKSKDEDEDHGSDFGPDSGKADQAQEPAEHEKVELQGEDKSADQMQDQSAEPQDPVPSPVQVPAPEVPAATVPVQTTVPSSSSIPKSSKPRYKTLARKKVAPARIKPYGLRDRPSKGPSNTADDPIIL